eukprot:6283345-Amphidinium_carterae.1
MEIPAATGLQQMITYWILRTITVRFNNMCVCVRASRKSYAMHPTGVFCGAAMNRPTTRSSSNHVARGSAKNT